GSVRKSVGAAIAPRATMPPSHTHIPARCTKLATRNGTFGESKKPGGKVIAREGSLPHAPLRGRARLLRGAQAARERDVRATEVVVLENCRRFPAHRAPEFFRAAPLDGDGVQAMATREAGAALELIDERARDAASASRWLD